MVRVAALAGWLAAGWANAAPVWQGPTIESLPGGPEGVAAGPLVPSQGGSPVPDSIVGVSYNGFNGAPGGIPGPANVRIWTWQSGSFGTVDLLAGNQPRAVAIGNAVHAAPPAGQNDVVIVNSTDSTLSIFTANASPVPNPPFFSIDSPVSLPSSSNPVAIAVAADLAHDPFSSGPYRSMAVAANGTGSLLVLSNFNGVNWTLSSLAFPTPSYPVSVAFGSFAMAPGATPSPVVAVADSASKTVRLVGWSAGPAVVATICLPLPAGSTTPAPMAVAFGPLSAGAADTLAIADATNDQVLLFGNAAATPTVIPAPPLSTGGNAVAARFHAVPGCTCSPTAWASSLFLVEQSAQTLRSLCNQRGGSSVATGARPVDVAVGDFFATGFADAAVSAGDANEIQIVYPSGALPTAPLTFTPINSPTPPPSPTMTSCPSLSLTFTGSPTVTMTVTATATETLPPGTVFSVTNTVTNTQTFTITYTPTITRTAYPTTTETSTTTYTQTLGSPSATETLTLTATSTPATWIVDKNYIAPRNYDIVTIYFPTGHGLATAAIYTPSGNRVRSLGSTTSDSIYWDGVNDAGQVVSVGIYLFYVHTQVGDRIFKVAVTH